MQKKLFKTHLRNSRKYSLKIFIRMLKFLLIMIKNLKMNKKLLSTFLNSLNLKSEKRVMQEKCQDQFKNMQCNNVK